MNFDQISKHIHSELIIVQKEVKLSSLEDLFLKYFSLYFSPIDPKVKLIYSKTLLSAFLHKSFSHEFSVDLSHNEKLEFLGDSVLQLIISDLLYRKYPEMNEGELSKLRSAIVNENTLNELAQLFEFNKWILLGKGELKELGHLKKSILANTFEAVLGSIFIDTGLEGARHFIDLTIELYKTRMNKDLLDASILNDFDPKTKLQEIVMKKYKTTPRYICEVIKKGKQDCFSVSLHIDEKIIDSIIHSSKKKAMQLLAKKILENNLV